MNFNNPIHLEDIQKAHERIKDKARGVADSRLPQIVTENNEEVNAKHPS